MQIRPLQMVSRRLASMLALFLFCRQAAAISYFSDGINYTAGTVLGNDSPWTSAQSSITVAAGSLTYSNLTAVSPGANMIMVSSNSSSVYSYAPLNTTVTNGTVFMSFMIKYTAFTGSFTRGGILQSTNTPAALVITNDPLDFVDNTYSTGFKLGIRAKDGTSSYVTNSYSPLQVGTTYFVVMEYNFTNGYASMWLNPALGGSQPAADATSVPVSAIVSDLKYLYFRAGSAAPGYQVDNIQVGSTWQDVTMTPYSASKLVVTLPGQTFTSGSGNSGTPTSQATGIPFNLSLSAVMADGVTLSTNYSGTKTIAYTGPGQKPVFTTNVTFVNSRATGLATILNSSQITTIKATDGTLAGVASSSVTVENAFYNYYDAGPGFISGENLILTNLSGLNLYAWSAYNPGLSVSNWTPLGAMFEQPLNDGTGRSYYSINFSPTNSPSYCLISDTNSAPYYSPEPVGIITTPDFATFTVTITNVAISSSGVLALAPPAPPTISAASLTAGAFQFSFTGTSGQPYSILASTNLVSWSVISTGTIGNSAVVFTDPATTNFSTRFYQVRFP